MTNATTSDPKINKQIAKGEAAAKRDRADRSAPQLIENLWWFIENVNEDTPDRTDRFFALRERVREYYSGRRA